MKWLPTASILFSVGIVCVTAETAGAKPWYSFVSDQQIFEAQTIRCDFTRGVGQIGGRRPRHSTLPRITKCSEKSIQSAISATKVA
jgi:hypothetical protein